jgi:hypothetical protein
MSKQASDSSATRQPTQPGMRGPPLESLDTKTQGHNY